MSATDEPRRLLNELRKLACDINEKEIRSHSVITLNQGRYNRQFRLDMNHDWLNAWHAELERILQAIEAMLGVTDAQRDAGMIEKAAERIEVLSGFAREYLHRYGMLMSMAGEDVTDEVLAMESAINEVCGKKVMDE